jgi:fatty-acyl-CoA synthase
VDATMMSLPLSTQLILAHGATLHARSRVCTFDGERFAASAFADVAARARALAAALVRLGVQQGDRVATFCWNHREHLEAYLAVPSGGHVLHTLNVRLYAPQIAQIMAHAEDRVLIVDAALLPVLRPVLADVPTLEHVIVVGGAAEPLPAVHVHEYEALLAGGTEGHEWPVLKERSAAVVCYTTGTTGEPKGVVYAHRSIFLHTLASLGVDTFGIREADRVLMMPAMFHANAWGLPYSCWFAGADMLMPGPHLKAANVRTMVEAERPTFTAVVPTVINDLLLADSASPIDMSSFRVIVSGGSAVATALIEEVRRRWNVPVLQGWGMTETSPLCCLSHPPRDTPPEEQARWRAKSGRPVPGMQVRLRGDDGAAVPHDGTSVGELQLRGPWVTGAYHRGASRHSFTADGWLRTGDVGTIDERGYVQITDRAKDVIKSGGEWVSSVDLENQLLHHPAVHEAAVIGVPDPRWEERPLPVVVLKPGQEVTPEELRAFLEPRVARFWLPERWAFAEELPKTSVGKLDKKELRKRYADGLVAVRKVPGRSEG